MTAIQNPLSYCRTTMEQMLERLDASEISITFKQQWRDLKTNEEIKEMIRKYFNYLPFNGLRELIMITEYGTSKHLHYHGIIRGKVKDLSELNNMLNKRFGRSYIRTIKYPESYVKYMMKEQDDDLIEDMIYIKYNEEEKKPIKITVKLPPKVTDHPLISKQYKKYDISIYFN